MNLGFYYHVPAIYKDKKIYTHGAQGVFIDSLAPHCERIICFLHSPQKHEEEQCNYWIRSGNVELENIGLHSRVPQRMINSRMHTSNLKKRKDDIDILLLRGPSPLLPAMAKRVPTLPKAFLLVASYVDGVDSLPQPWWRKELIRLWSHWNEWQQLELAKKSLTFVNSAKLFGNLKNSVENLIETKTTTISEKDFYIRDDTCLNAPYHILFSGRIASEKGIDDILKALHLLKEQGINFVFDLIGVPGTKDSLEKLTSYANSLGLTNQVRYHGFKTVGEELWKYYRDADVYIIASRSSFEGFPRTIWEAFSQSTPVIATKVGSIPFFLRHERDALLASPNNPEELAFLLNRVITEPELRRRLIRNGRQLAQQNTLDFRAKEMMNCIEDWLRDRATIHAN